MSAEVGIVETRNIIRLINELYQYDFSDFALTSFKRRLENLIVVHNLKTADNLFTKIREDKIFFDIMLHEIIVEPTEMFRDPSLWRLLRDEYIPLFTKNNGHFKIWFPMTVSGEDLYSFLILLKETGQRDKCEIIVSHISEKSKETISAGRIKISKLEVSKDNYTRFHGAAKFEDYCQVKENSLYFNESLYKDVTFSPQHLIFDGGPKLVDMIFFRNQMLYYNQGFQDRVLDVFYDSLNFNGYLVPGIRERLFLVDARKNLRLTDANENIYQKK